MWIYGFHPVREALRHGGVLRVWVHRERRDARLREIEALCSEAGIELSSVSAAKLDRVASGSHNGFAAEADGLAEPEATAEALVVLVEDVQDPRNLGALLRVCDATGVGRVLIRDRGSAQVTAAAAKTSAGAVEWLQVERVTNTAATLRQLKQEGFWVYGAAEGGLPPWELDLTGKLVLCIGGESSGLRRLTRETCDALIGLPMSGGVESLNLSTAAAAILYEVVRQRCGASRDSDS